MTCDDETLMAYVDGELDDARRAEIAAALQNDPVLRQRVETQRALRARVAGAYSAVPEDAVPDALLAAARGPKAAASNGNVVQFPKRAAQAPAPPWRAREWFAMAASLVLGIVISWRAFAPGGALIETSDGALVARGELAKALDGQRVIDNSADRIVSIGLSFETRGGGYCRSFALPGPQTTGLACREKGEWQIPATAASNSSRSDMQQAAGAIPPAILAAIEARISGEPLDAAGEASAVRDGWRPGAQSK
ncbi:MAG: anti-sigma factor [Steroidobacteraceae bacterium]|nr:anti-sigma factor [Steroidobacteraceae bacterium]